MSRPASASPPGHLMVLGIVFLIWFAILAADNLIVRFRLPVDVPSLDAAFRWTPFWAQIGWALSVWLGLLASIFALMRDDAAVLMYFAALLGALAAVFGGVIVGLPPLILGVNQYAVFGLVLLVPLIGWLYTRSMKRAAILG